MSLRVMTFDRFLSDEFVEAVRESEDYRMLGKAANILIPERQQAVLSPSSRSTENARFN